MPTPSKNQRLNACSVLLSRKLSLHSIIHKHAHILSHKYASGKCYNIRVNVVVYLCTLRMFKIVGVRT